MLLLVFRIAGDAYAVEAARVVEVVPRVELRRCPTHPRRWPDCSAIAGGWFR